MDFSDLFCWSLKLTCQPDHPIAQVTKRYSQSYLLFKLQETHETLLLYAFFLKKAWRNIHNAHAANTKTPPRLCPESCIDIRAW